MKLLASALFIASAFAMHAQIKTPALSPTSEVKQTIGISEIKVEYSRPSKRGRNVFPDVVPYGQIWRAGANKNSILSTDASLLFGKDTLKAGSYALFVKPETAKWTIYFYKNTENWGTPANWDKNLVAVEITAPVTSTSSVETFTIGFDKIEINGGELVMSWDNVMVKAPFTVLDAQKIDKEIKKVLAGPTANDYYRAADYYINSNGDMRTASEYIDKAIALFGDNVPFHVLRKKAIIQANLKDFKGAIETAKKSIEAAKKAGNDEYVKMNEASIKEWSSKK